MKKLVNLFHKNRWFRWGIYGVLFVAVVSGIRGYQHRGLHSGKVIPFEGELADLASFELAQMKGKPFLLHFWANWCPVCRTEQDSINSVAEDYPVITVAMWSENLAAYMEENGLTFTTVNDPAGEISRRYGVRSVPTSFFVDADGTIRFVEVGYTSELGFRARLWWLD